MLTWCCVVYAYLVLRCLRLPGVALFTLTWCAGADRQAAPLRCTAYGRRGRRPAGNASNPETVTRAYGTA